MEPGGSSPRSQEPFTGSYPEQHFCIIASYLKTGRGNDCSSLRRDYVRYGFVAKESKDGNSYEYDRWQQLTALVGAFQSSALQ
jgi:hypothetical protein